MFSQLLKENCVSKNMNIAGITITLNDGYKLKEWQRWYEEYKGELGMHIIVDNGSEPDFIRELKTYFRDSIIIERKSNGACTIAYNDGIKKALEDKSIDGIMLIGNDIRIRNGSITKLYEFLYSNEKLGIVSPICLKKDSDVVEDYGARITKFLTMDADDSGAGKRIEDISELSRFSETVLGGCCLAKPEFYEKVGLQDEKLFMYSDEVDTGIRARLAGFSLGYIREAVAWHQHINPGGGVMRSTMAPYLICRNKVYLAKKHFGLSRVILVFLFQCANYSRLVIKNLGNCYGRRYYAFGIKGTIAGLLGNMSNDSQLWK